MPRTKEERDKAAKEATAKERDERKPECEVSKAGSIQLVNQGNNPKGNNPRGK